MHAKSYIHEDSHYLCCEYLGIGLGGKIVEIREILEAVRIFSTGSLYVLYLPNPDLPSMAYFWYTLTALGMVLVYTMYPQLVNKAGFKMSLASQLVYKSNPAMELKKKIYTVPNLLTRQISRCHL